MIVRMHFERVGRTHDLDVEGEIVGECQRSGLPRLPLRADLPRGPTVLAFIRGRRCGLVLRLLDVDTPARSVPPGPLRSGHVGDGPPSCSPWNADVKSATITRPCTRCPFRSDVPVYLHPERRADIIEQSLVEGREFYCHETTVYDEDSEEMTIGAGSLICAGFVKMVEAGGGSTNMMRVAERIGLYDATQVERGADVWDQDEFAVVPEGAVKRDGLIVDHETGLEVEVAYVTPCGTVNFGCLAPAGWIGAGGGIVNGTTSADSECPGCGEPVCSNCADSQGRCGGCTEEEDGTEDGQ